MSLTVSGSFGASVGSPQRFSREFLARQLPGFQERVPKGTQGPPKYPTNAPPNLPIPPLLPGEEVLLQQHRVACVDCFPEPAVGSVYITNFRVIFNGNSISDPEEREAMLEGLPTRKEVVLSEGSKKLPKAALMKLRHRSSEQMATFNSYLTNPEQKTSNKSGSAHSRWHDLQSKLGSFRRTGRSTSENHLNKYRKSASLQRPSKVAPIDVTDGSGGNGSFNQVMTELSSVFSRGHSLHIVGRRHGTTTKETAHWDSASSISSVSEVSECPTTGTDEMGDHDSCGGQISPLPLEPVFMVGSIEATISEGTFPPSINGTVPNGSSCSIPTIVPPDTPVNSLNAEDGDINMTDTDSLNGVFGNHGNRGQSGSGAKHDEVDFEKYSSSVLVLNPSLNPVLVEEAKRLDLKASVDPALLMDPSLEKRRQAETRRSWFHKAHSADSTLHTESATDEDDSGDDRSHNWNQALSDEQPLPGPVQGYSRVQILGAVPTPSGKTSSQENTNVTQSAPATYTPPFLHHTSRSSAASSSSRREITTKRSPHSSSLPARGKLGSSEGSTVGASHRHKPLPPTPPRKPHSHLSGQGREGKGKAGSRGRGLENGRGQEGRRGMVGRGGRRKGGEDRVAGKEEGECQPCSGYANLPLSRSHGALCRERSSSNPMLSKKPKPLPRLTKADTLERLNSKDKSFVSSLPPNFRPLPPPRKPTLTYSPRSLRSSPAPARQQGSQPHAPSTPDPGSNTTANTHTSKRGGNVKPHPHSPQPVPPPRRKRKSKEHPSRQNLSPIYSPPPDPVVGDPSRPSLDSSLSSPAASDELPSDTGSSDLDRTLGGHHEASPESDLSSTLGPAPPPPSSPAPHSSTTSPSPEWLQRSVGDRNSSTLAHRCSVPSERLSLPQSPFHDDHSTFGYVGEQEILLALHTPLWSSPKNRNSHALMPTSTRYTFSSSLTLTSIHSIKKVPSLHLREEGIRLPDGLLIRTRNFRHLKLHIHPCNSYDTDGLRELLERKILTGMKLPDLFAFRYCTAIRHPNPLFLQTTSLPNFYRLADEMERMKLSGSRVWHVTSILKKNPNICPSYPEEVLVPRCIPDVDLVRGARLYRHGRFPILAWSCLERSAFLLRAAPTVTHRGQSVEDMRLDEAILQAVCVSTELAQGSTKLYIFTEKPDSTPAALSDPMHISLTEAQKRAYYYQNCQFQYMISPPTHKNTRHSFNKMTAIFEDNKVGEDEFLIALDDTRWLQRIQELLHTSCEVCRRVDEERASVLVSYDNGWDRTTQITSLVQLLLDPYFRTMDGFQVLVQKEWVSFGHPFQSRHNRLGRAKEDGPIFLQWVDCVWQVMQQCPSAFEFNERFLMVLVESSYSSQFGTFLLNSYQERHQTFSSEAHKHKSVATHTISFWIWVAMVNASGRTFYNNLYDPNTYPWAVYPNCAVPCLRLWTSHYCPRKSQEYSSSTSVLQKELEELVQQYKRQSGQSDVPLTSRHSKTLSLSPPPVPLPEECQGTPSNSPSLVLPERVTGTHSGRSSRSRTPGLYQTISQYLLTQDIDATVCKHAEVSSNTCQGYLIKLGGFRKNWQERWFVLDFSSELLTYFENRDVFASSDRGTPRGVIPLSMVTKVWQNTEKKDHLIRHIFTVETKNRTYLFRAPSLLTMQLWIAVLAMPSSLLHPDS